MSTAIDHLVAFLRTGAESVTDVHRDLYNQHQEGNWTQTRDFLAMHYKVNGLDQSEFWDFCRNDLPLGDAQDILDYYVAVGPDFQALQPGFEQMCSGPRATLHPRRPTGSPSTAAQARPGAVATWDRWKAACEVGAGEVGMSDHLMTFVGAISVSDSASQPDPGMPGGTPTDSNPERAALGVAESGRFSRGDSPETVLASARDR